VRQSDRTVPLRVLLHVLPHLVLALLARVTHPRASTAALEAQSQQGPARRHAPGRQAIGAPDPRRTTSPPCSERVCTRPALVRRVRERRRCQYDSGEPCAPRGRLRGLPDTAPRPARFRPYCTPVLLHLAGGLLGVHSGWRDLSRWTAAGGAGRGANAALASGSTPSQRRKS